MVLMEFSIAPVGQGESVSAHVARVIDLIDSSGLPYQLTPMGTIVEGEWEQCIGLMSSCFGLLKAEFPRIGVQMKVDYRDAPGGRLKSKTAKVEQRLGRKLST
jgi:uncharacterized protein (TIGR00106 family)